jgi:predicted Zn-dependent peptidase
MRSGHPSALHRYWLLLALVSLFFDAERQASAQSIRAPRPKEEFEIRLPIFEQSTLPNGLTIYVYQDNSLPLLAVSLAVRTGSGAEPAHKGGLSTLAYRMLGEQASDEAVEGGLAVRELGSRLGVNVSPEGALLSVYVMAAQGERAISTLAALVQHAQVQPAALPRLKSELLGRSDAALGWPGVIAEDHLLRLLYGPQHPYGHVLSGIPATVKAITPEDIAAYYACAFSPQNIALVVTGRVAPGSVREWAARSFGSWQTAGLICNRPVPPTVAGKRTQVIAIAKPGLVQSLLMIGRVMLPIGHPDELALRLADSHLGSRAYHELRQKQAVTYGVSWHLLQGLYEGHLELSTLVQANKTGEALSEILSQLFLIQRDPVSARLVISARLGQAWGIMSRYDSLARSVSHVGLSFLLHQPLSKDQLDLQRLKQIGPDQVDEAGYHYFNGDTMQIVVVGDPKVINEQVAPLKLGRLRWGQPDGTVTDSP